MEKLYNTCMELKAISSTNYKKAFLEQHKDDSEFTDLLKFLLNPRIVTGISKAKLNKEVPLVRGFIGRVEGLYSYLELNNTGRDSDIAMCQGFVSKHPEYKDFLSSIITKTLKLGVDTKLCNTVYGKIFIPVHEVMQGSPRDKLRLKNGEQFWLTQKLNGVRATYLNDGDGQNGQLVSRQGIPFTGTSHIIEELNKIQLSYGCDLMFDGELIRKNVGGLSDGENFRIGTGLINSDEADKTSIEFVIFDVMPLHEFSEGKSRGCYSNRRFVLDQLHETENGFNHLRFVPVLYHGSDTNKIDEWLEWADSMGYEGLMLNKDAPYECKRTTNLIKIKSFKHSDLRIVGYEEGEGKYVGMLGAVVVEYKGNKVSVGSGLTDEQRVEYWAKRDELIGKIVEVKYKEETSDKKTGLKSMQFPTWVQMRLDRDSVSYE